MSAQLSVIIPTYNRLWCLPKAVESCKNSICETEIIVVDDGSNDGTWEWLQKQQGIIAIRQNNWGKCWAVNKAFALATGKYIRFLDSDDMLELHANDEQLRLAESDNADIVVSGYKVIDEDDKIVRVQEWTYCDDFIAQQLGECDSSHYSSYLFKKSFVNDISHRPDYAFRDDRLFVLEAALKNPVVSIYNGTALLHRVHSFERLQLNSGLKSTVQNFQHVQIYKKIFSILDSRDELTERRKKAAIRILWPLTHWIAKTDLKEAGSVYKWIKELDPDFIIPEEGLIGKMYRSLGFDTTERIFSIRRKLKYGL